MTAQEKLDAYMDQLIEDLKTENPTLKTDLATVFSKVTETERKYLAIWGYVRFPKYKRGSMKDNWPAKGGKIDAAVDAAVDKVVKKFEDANKGHTLSVVKDVRSLEKQIKLWNDNKTTVKQLGKELHTKLLTEITKYGDDPANAEDMKKFRDYLYKHTFPRKKSRGNKPTNATPGLSMHGTGRAFDFKVKKGSQTIAGTSTKDTSIAVWDGKDNWTQKLKDAVAAANKEVAGGDFDGPLPAPYEPWHYNFIKN